MSAVANSRSRIVRRVWMAVTIAYLLAAIAFGVRFALAALINLDATDLTTWSALLGGPWVELYLIGGAIAVMVGGIYVPFAPLWIAAGYVFYAIAFALLNVVLAVRCWVIVSSYVRARLLGGETPPIMSPGLVSEARRGRLAPRWWDVVAVAGVSLPAFVVLAFPDLAESDLVVIPSATLVGVVCAVYVLIRTYREGLPFGFRWVRRSKSA